MYSFFKLKILRKPIFAGDSEIDQLYKIFRVLGTPNENVWPGVSQMPDFRTMFPQWEPQRLHERIHKYNADDIFSKLMVYDPSKRISAKNAMSHSYFDDVELVDVVLPEKFSP